MGRMEGYQVNQMTTHDMTWQGFQVVVHSTTDSGRRRSAWVSGFPLPSSNTHYLKL